MKQCCEKYMVEDYLQALYSEAKSIIAQERQQDMTNMYILLRSVPKNLVPYMNDFKDHIVEEGLQRLSDIKGDNVRNALFRMFTGFEDSNLQFLVSDVCSFRRYPYVDLS